MKTIIFVILFLSCIAFCQSPPLGEFDHWQIYCPDNSENPWPLSYNWALNWWEVADTGTINNGKFNRYVVFFDSDMQPAIVGGLKVVGKLSDYFNFSGPQYRWQVQEKIMLTGSAYSSRHTFRTYTEKGTGIAKFSVGTEQMSIGYVNAMANISIHTPLMPQIETMATRWYNQKVGEDTPYPIYATEYDIWHETMQSNSISDIDQTFLSGLSSPFVQWRNSDNTVATKLFAVPFDGNDIDELLAAATPYYISIAVDCSFFYPNHLTIELADSQSSSFLQIHLAGISGSSAVYHSDNIILVTDNSATGEFWDMNGDRFLLIHTATPLSLEMSEYTFEEFIEQWLDMMEENNFVSFAQKQNNGVSSIQRLCAGWLKTTEKYDFDDSGITDFKDYAALSVSTELINELKGRLN